MKISRQLKYIGTMKPDETNNYATTHIFGCACCQRVIEAEEFLDTRNLLHFCRGIQR